jgi:hypothetical protein
VTPEEWAEAIYDATGWTIGESMAKAIGTLVETQAKGEIVLLRAEVEWLRDERERLAKEMAKAQLAVLPWMDQVGFLNAEYAYLTDALKKISAASTDETGVYARRIASEALEGSEKRCEQ